LLDGNAHAASSRNILNFFSQTDLNVKYRSRSKVYW